MKIAHIVKIVSQTWLSLKQLGPIPDKLNLKSETRIMLNKNTNFRSSSQINFRIICCI